MCFETLLQFSFSNKVTTPQEGYISRMALSVLLKRSQDVLHRYIEDERLSGKCPLPRYVCCFIQEGNRLSPLLIIKKALKTKCFYKFSELNLRLFIILSHTM